MDSTQRELVSILRAGSCIFHISPAKSDVSACLLSGHNEYFLDMNLLVNAPLTKKHFYALHRGAAGKCVCLSSN